MFRLGMIGSGWMGRTYAEALKLNTGVKLAAVAGGSRAEALAADFDAKFVPTVDELIEGNDVDGLLMATPNQVHAEQTLAAAEHGKHVLVEKPMATNVADCDAMIAACKNAGVVLSVIKTLRYWSTLRRSKELIDEGRIGDVRMIQATSLNTMSESFGDTSWTQGYKNWFLQPESSGVLADRGSHIFDMLRWLVGHEATQVFGHVESVNMEQWMGLSGMAQVQFANGASSQVWLSHEIADPGFPKSGYRFRIWGESGLIDCNAHGKLLMSQDGEWTEVMERTPFNRLETPHHPTRLEPYTVQIQDFVESCQAGGTPEVTGEDGRAAVEMVEATFLSSLAGTAVNLPLPKAKGGFQFDGATVPRDTIPG